MILTHPLAGLDQLCQLFGVTRDAFYKAEKRVGRTVLADSLILDELVQIRKDMPLLGTEKLLLLLQPFLVAHGIKLGRDKLYTLLRKHHLLPKVKRKLPRLTQSGHHYYKYPNLIANLEPTAPNQIWVSDISYIELLHGFSYLSLVTDAYSHKVVGWSLQSTLEMIGPYNALKMALKENKIGTHNHLINHSDRGVQYCSNQYIALLKKYRITISMAKASYQNPIAERMNGILKTELLKEVYLNHQQALIGVISAIAIYNQKRPHRSINMMCPNQAHQCQGKLEKKWKETIKQKNRKKKKLPIESNENIP